MTETGMQTHVARWGNSLALRLPKSVVSDAKLKEGSSVEISVEGGRLVVTPARPKYRLEELLAGHGPDTVEREVDWGDARGEEAW